MKKHVGKYTENGIGALVSGQGIAHGNNEANAMRPAAENGKFFAEKCNLFRAGALYKRKQGRRSGFRAA